MKTVIQDDRTEAQKESHKWAVKATDKFMSGWGGAAAGSSMCCWAIDSRANGDRLFDWVSKRPEMKRVSWVNLKTYRPPSNCAHFHIYVAGDNHPAFN